MRRIAAFGMMLILAGIQPGCFESVTEAPLELAASTIAAPEGLHADVGDGMVTIGWRTVEGARRYRVYRAVDSPDCLRARDGNGGHRVRGHGRSERPVLLLRRLLGELE